MPDSTNAVVQLGKLPDGPYVGPAATHERHSVAVVQELLHSLEDRSATECEALAIVRLDHAVKWSPYIAEMGIVIRHQLETIMREQGLPTDTPLPATDAPNGTALLASEALRAMDWPDTASGTSMTTQRANEIIARLHYPAAQRGYKTLAAARKGHETVHGTDEEKQARGRVYVEDHARFMAGGYTKTQADDAVASKHGCSAKTVQRARRKYGPKT